MAAAAGVSPSWVHYYFQTKAKPAERVAKSDLGAGTTDQVLRW